eukprot:4415537-Prymnesium_polylepis.1
MASDSIAHGHTPHAPRTDLRVPGVCYPWERAPEHGLTQARRLFRACCARMSGVCAARCTADLRLSVGFGWGVEGAYRARRVYHAPGRPTRTVRASGGDLE